MKPISANFAALQCDGKIICGNPDTTFNGICIDSREGRENTLFVALKGEVTDGHKYIKSAVKKGCSVVLSELDEIYDNCCVIKVDNTLKAFHKIAAAYKAQFDVKTIGITGSVGKTTTKEFVYAVVSSEFNTLKSQGNYNSETGMPITAFNLEEYHTAAVFEMGMDAKGEIAALTKIARPDIAVITNIGVMHIEHLGSKENILKAKLEIERGLRRSGVMVLNADDEMLWGCKDKLKHKIVYYGIENKEASVRAENVARGNGIMTFDIVTPVGTLPAVIYTEGVHNVLNALAAVAVGLYCGIPFAKCVEALKTFENTGMRQKVYDYEGVTVIEDCYNAGPDSMKASLELLKNKNPRRIAVLSDMLELGKFSEKYHREIGFKAYENCDILIAYGDNSAFICDEAKKRGMEKVFYCANSDEAGKILLENAKENDTILFKGSRGMKTEAVLEIFKKGWEK